MDAGTRARHVLVLKVISLLVVVVVVLVVVVEVVVAVLEMSLFVRFARGREETQRDGGGMTLRVLVPVL